MYVHSYRLWITEEKRFRYCDYIPTMGFVWAIDGTKLELGENYPQAFTGLKDQGGREIYDGDICKVLEHSLGWKHGIVQWGKYSDDEYVRDLECWVFSRINFEEISPLSCIVYNIGINWSRGIETSPSAIEVIGNIMENPELLEKC